MSNDERFLEFVKAGRHPSTLGLLQFFTFEHLPVHLMPPSRLCADMAFTMVKNLPDTPELTSGLRKLLEAKDCFVRGSLESKDVGVYSWTDR